MNKHIVKTVILNSLFIASMNGMKNTSHSFNDILKLSSSRDLLNRTKNMKGTVIMASKFVSTISVSVKDVLPFMMSVKAADETPAGRDANKTNPYMFSPVTFRKMK